MNNSVGRNFRYFSPPHRSDADCIQSVDEMWNCISLRIEYLRFVAHVSAERRKGTIIACCALYWHVQFSGISCATDKSVHGQNPRSHVCFRSTGTNWKMFWHIITYLLLIQRKADFRFLDNSKNSNQTQRKSEMLRFLWMNKWNSLDFSRNRSDLNRNTSNTIFYPPCLFIRLNCQQMQYHQRYREKIKRNRLQASAQRMYPSENWWGRPKSEQHRTSIVRKCVRGCVYF